MTTHTDQEKFFIASNEALHGNKSSLQIPLVQCKSETAHSVPTKGLG